jgi:preprotein translocase subunit SecD
MFSFVQLFAHKCLYFVRVLRFCGATMKVCARRFNTYLLLAAALAFFCGCQTDEKNKKIGAIYIHLQAPAIGTSETVNIGRSTPVTIRIGHEPILTEANILGAKVRDDHGGFVIAIQFDESGSLVLEQYTGSETGRHFAIYGLWGDTAAEGRWLAAPVIRQRISDGVLTFTADCSREEADKLVAGLNVAAKKIQKAKF